MLEYRYQTFAISLKKDNLLNGHFQVYTIIRYKETAGKSSCFENPLFLDILNKFDHLRWPNLAKTVKRHIYMPRHSYEAHSYMRLLPHIVKKIFDGQTDGQTPRRTPSGWGLILATKGIMNTVKSIKSVKTKQIIIYLDSFYV